MIECKPIVSEAIFDAAREQREKNKRIKKSRGKHQYFLSGMTVCGECNKSAIGKVTGNMQHKYYRCAAQNNPKRYGYKCESKMHRVEVIDEPVWNWLKSILLDSETLDRSLDEYQQTTDETQDPILRMIESSENKLTDLEGQQRRLIEAYTTGILTLDDLAKNKTDLDKQIADTRKTIETLIRPKIQGECGANGR